MSIRQVDPSSISLQNIPFPGDVQHQMYRLMTEGQIEPIALLSDGSPDLDSWVYAEAQIQAAIELGWSNILVTP